MSLVQWREWNDEAFAEARAQDKPILLDIGAVWCHWCHVMDDGIPGDPLHTGTYSNPQVAAFIHERYIPIKVDNDRRPDINARYNMGGWPTTAFLTPEGDILYGATYLPPSQMLSLLHNVAGYYASSKHEIREKLAEHQQAQALAHQQETTGELSDEIAPAVAEFITSNFDPLYGGFGTQPKFPHPDVLIFCIERYARTGDAELRLVAEKTLLAMAGGGMYDAYAGGFFRYSTTRDWSIPHFEKMLHDNARLASVCLLAAQVFGDEKYAEIARDVHRFLFDVMLDSTTSTFAGSQDADKEEEYYGLPLSERAKLPTPYIDHTVYCDWNALAVSSLVLRYRLYGGNEILDAAQANYQFLITHVAPRHFYADGKAQGVEHLLTDLTALIDAALDLFEATHERHYLDEARGMGDLLLSDLEDEGTWGFLDMPRQPNALGALSEPRKDQSQNADAALALTRLSAFTENPRYRMAAARALVFFLPDYARTSFFAAGYARAVEAVILEPLHIVLVGDATDPRRQDLLDAAWRTYAPNKTVEARLPEDAGEYPADPDGLPRAYVCIGTNCLAPMSDPRSLKEVLRNEPRQSSKT